MNLALEKTGVIYCRVSSKEQTYNTSLPMQEKLCREYANRENIHVLKVFVEQGESAKTVKRTEFKKALDFCTEKGQKVDYFIVHRFDRFARNNLDHVTTSAFLKKFHTDLRSVSEPVDDTPLGHAMEGIFSIIAELDNSTRAIRCKNGMEERVKEGKWVWGAPLGYKRLITGGNLVLDEDMAPFIHLMFEEKAKGTHSYRSLAKFLHERGFRTRKGKKIYPQRIQEMIENPVYRGMIHGFGMEVIGAFPPIVSDELFFSCQRGARTRAWAVKKNTYNPDFPLRKLVVCPECQKSLTGSFSRGRHGIRYPYYHHQSQGCSLAKFVKKDELESGFAKHLKKISPRHQKFEKAFKAVILDVWKSNYKKLDTENARIRKEITSLEDVRQRVFVARFNEELTEEEFFEQKHRVNLLINQKKNLLDEKRIEEFDMEAALSHCFDLVRDSGKTWSDLKDTPEYRIRFQKMIFPQNVTFNGKEFGTAKLGLIYEMNQHFRAGSSDLVDPSGFEPLAFGVQNRRSTK